MRGYHRRRAQQAGVTDGDTGPPSGAPASAALPSKPVRAHSRAGGSGRGVAHAGPRPPGGRRGAEKALLSPLAPASAAQQQEAHSSGVSGCGPATAAEADAMLSGVVVDDTCVCSAAKNTAVALGDDVRGYGSEEVRALSILSVLAARRGNDARRESTEPIPVGAMPPAEPTHQLLCETRQASSKSLADGCSIVVQEPATFSDVCVSLGMRGATPRALGLKPKALQHDGCLIGVQEPADFSHVPVRLARRIASP